VASLRDLRRHDPLGHDRGIPDPDRERPRLAIAVLTGILPTSVAYTAFANPTIVLIIVAFLVARAVVKTGLGQRLGHRAISLFGGRRWAVVRDLRGRRVIAPASRATRRAPA
jgi:hypothetical protein